MANQIKVSVIVLTYNHEKYLAQALESIVCQKTNFRFEILINDDASTDNTKKIAEEYVLKYPNIIRFFRQEKNIGSTRSGYEMLINCYGEYIASCEGDDYWCNENKLQIQADFLDAHSDYSACAHEVSLVDENGDLLNTQKLSWISKKRDYAAKDFKGIFLPGHPNSLMRRNYFLNPEYDGSFFYKAHRYIGDRTNAMIWAANGKIYRFPDIMGCYRCVRKKDGVNITSLMYVNNRKRIEDDFQYTLTLEKYANEFLGCKEINFEYHKHELYVSAICGFLKNDCDFALSAEIINSCKSKILCILHFPFLFMQKWLKHLMDSNL